MYGSALTEVLKYQQNVGADDIQELDSQAK